MEQIIINKAECTGCGFCAMVCPDRAIAMVADRAEYLADSCLFCGHCQAVCPAAAVHLPELPARLGLQTLAETETALAPGTAQVSELVALMRSRRSCRHYRQEPVALALLEDLVKIGTTAPSGTNSQAWAFIIIPTCDDLQVLGGLVAGFYRRLNRLATKPLLRFVHRLIGGGLERYYRRYFDSVTEALRQWDGQGVDRLFHGAVAAILVTGKKQASCPAEDALLATQNILLAAHAMGLGSCLIGFAVEAIRRDSRLKRQLGIGGDEEIYSVIALGYPAIPYLRPAPRKTVVPRFLRLAETVAARGEGQARAMKAGEGGN